MMAVLLVLTVFAGVIVFILLADWIGQAFENWRSNGNE